MALSVGITSDNRPPTDHESNTLTDGQTNHTELSYCASMQCVAL